jgi:hypothetical protein
MSYVENVSRCIEKERKISMNADTKDGCDSPPRKNWKTPIILRLQYIKTDADANFSWNS